MIGENFDIPGYFHDAISVLDQYHKKYGRVPDDLIYAIKSELERFPLFIAISFYSLLLCEYPALAELFCEDTDDGDDGDIGPLSLQLEKQALQIVEMHYHQ